MFSFFALPILQFIFVLHSGDVDTDFISLDWELPNNFIFFCCKQLL